MPRTLHTLLALTLSLSPALAFAQSGDDWSGFPSTTPKTETTPQATPDVPVAPRPVPKKAPPPADVPRAEPDAGTPAATPEATPAPEVASAPQASPEAAPASADGGTSDDDKLPILSKKEKFIAGTEPHSPSTWGLGISDPGLGRLTVGPVSTGLLHLSSARLGQKGIARVSATGEYFSQNNFPVLSAGNVRTAGTFSAAFTPFTWGEIFIAYGAQANTNSRTSPNLLQALGDLTFGLKAGYEFFKSFNAAADVRLLTFSGVGNQSIDRVAVGFQPTLALTWDVRRLNAYVPALLHLNFGGIIDNTGNLIKSQRLNAAEEFALGVNRYGRITFGVGLEVPLPIATPFVEYNLEGPIGVTNGLLTGPDGVAVPLGQAMPNVLSLGLKVTVIKDLTLLWAVDIGLTRSVGLGVPATMPWNMIFGASFNIDVFQRGEEKITEIVRERPVEKKVALKPKTGHVEGVVTDARTKKPLGGAIIATGKSALVASDTEKGFFVSRELEPGPVRVLANRPGYKEAGADATIAAEKTATVDLALEPDVKPATFDLTVTGKKKPITATVAFSGGPEAKTAATLEGNAAPVTVEALPGKYSVSASADGWLAATRDVQIGESAKMQLAFDLQPAPKKSLVILKDDRIEILQQVHFQTGQATILADSFNLLSQVVDAIIKGGVKRIKIEGHTDNRGDKVKNQKLSQDRAASVADYLAAQGIDRARIEAAGFGDTRPVAPNLTARGRELNRRVEFLIIER